MRTIIAAWIIGALIVAWCGRLPDPYLQYVRQVPPPHPYPIGGVLWAVLFMAIQAAILAGVLRPSTYHRSWGRAAIALLVSVGFLSFAGMAVMHAPPYFFAYLWWLLAVAAVAAALLVWSGAGAVRRRAK